MAKCPRCGSRLKKKNNFACKRCGFVVSQTGSEPGTRCPSCNSTITHYEYDERKWKCTMCGNEW